MNIQIEELSAERLRESAELLTDVFPSLEPLTEALHLSRDFAATYVRTICDQCFENHLAITALDTDTDQLAGIALSLDDERYRQSLRVVPAEYRLALGQMDDFFEELSRPLAGLPGKGTNVFYLAVARPYWRAGISMALLRRLESLLRDKQYEYLVSEATNIKSAGAFRKQGYIEMNRLAYATRPLFAGLPGDCTLFMKRLAC